MGSTNYFFKPKNWYVIITVAFVFFTLTLNGCLEKNNDKLAKTSYDRIIESGKIRVAYISVPPACIVDPSTGNLSGITIEILNEIGKNTKLEIEYTEEVGWGTMIQGLDAGRYDMMGSNSWANPIRGKLATLSKPIYYSGIGIWVRANDNRFSKDNKWSSINKPNIKLGVMDGSTGEVIASTQFPDAQHASYTDLTGEPQLFMELVANKVDVIFAEPVQGLDFLKTNPGKAKNIASDSPIRIFANVYLLPKKEFQFKNMIDTALEDLQNSGFVDKVLKKYEPGQNVFYRVNRPYYTSPN